MDSKPRIIPYSEQFRQVKMLLEELTRHLNEEQRVLLRRLLTEFKKLVLIPEH